MATTQDIRMEVSDTDISFPILADTEIQYYLQKNEGNLRRTSLDCARAILMKLSMRGDQTVDIFSIKGSAAANSYRLALQLYLRNPDLNGMITSASLYAGGISLTDMQSNVDTTDNNYVKTANQPESYTYPPLDNPFVI